MKHLILFLTLFTGFLATGQSPAPKVVYLEIMDVVFSSETPNDGKDSLAYKTTPLGFDPFKNQKLPIHNTNEKLRKRPSVFAPIVLESDTSALMIFINQNSYITIKGLDTVIGDTLSISQLEIFEDCHQTKTWTSKTYYEEDAEGKIDYDNFSTKVTTTQEPKKGHCHLPDRVQLQINGRDYSCELNSRMGLSIQSTGQGYGRESWFSRKKPFHFRKNTSDIIYVGTVTLTPQNTTQKPF
ncbi:MAG: hypothetical protein SchgKO_10760 [Schleiferiaceae bacterium]